ncbi:MAG: hypothetical protein B7X99_09720 [Rhizobiales bacterium 17-65-6]|nr:MAG: hypothetical protein B7Z30_04520 [Rhizobiales bacterium 12-68-15]OYX89741.1 MAG: hypothetical protein B7Y84_03950 [Azorhizobium sp. 32-67-21]OYZ98953.1 MAG: hypothetical protein B7X99_09720 [Rhizobiales bacterium 17-65-6]
MSALRHLVHPGPATPDRRESLADGEGRALRVTLPPGASLHDGIVAALDAIGARSAAFTLLGGRFRALKYCIAAPNPQGPQVARYSTPIPAGLCVVLGGGGAAGLTPDGAPVIHCHALLADGAGQAFGGHLLPQESFADTDDPPVLLARAYRRIAIAQRPDPETAMTIFHPAEVPHA